MHGQQNVKIKHVLCSITFFRKWCSFLICGKIS